MSYVEQSLLYVLIFLIIGALVGMAARNWRKKPNGSKR